MIDTSRLVVEDAHLPAPQRDSDPRFYLGLGAANMSPWDMELTEDARGWLSWSWQLAVYGIVLAPATAEVLFSPYAAEPPGEMATERSGIDRYILVQDPSLANPVFARLEIDDEGLILVDAVTGIFGFGSTPREVVADFLLALRQHADVLATQRELSPELQDQLRYLDTHLAPPTLAVPAR